MRPLMMMRTKGISSPRFAKHAGIKGLSKSVGAFVGLPARTTLVPGVIGLTGAGAVIAIEGAALVAALAGGDIDPVIAQAPAEGETVPEGSTVEYTLTDTP